MHLSFAARICDTDYVLKNDFTDVGVLKPFDEVTCIVGTDVYKRQAYTGHPNAVGTYGAAINGTEDDDMKFLKVLSEKCEVFSAADVTAVDVGYNGGLSLIHICLYRSSHCAAQPDTV